MRTVPTSVLLLTALAGSLVACGDDDAVTSGGTTAGATVVVTTGILGDVVGELVGDAAAVEVIMPPSADPHDFAPSAQQAALMREADALVVNGLGFEEGLVDTIEGAESDGVIVIAATDGVDLLEYAEDGHSHEGDDEHSHEGVDEHSHEGDDEHSHEGDEHAAEGDDEHAPEGDDHSHDGDDPHFFTDPVRMASAVEHIAEELADNVEGLDTEAYRDRVATYLESLESLHDEVEDTLSAVADDRRVLVTNHEVFGYFADRYGFEVLGVVIPGGSTLAEPSARDLAELADAIVDEGVPAIFAEASAPAALADALAAEGTDVEVIELFSEALGAEGSGAETYLEMVRTNAQRIADALSG